MPRVGPHIVARPDRLHTRRCLSCGYGGPELQGDRGRVALRCPACDEDLYARPARSYSEMEGLDQLTLAARARSAPSPLQRLLRARSLAQRASRHWMVQLMGRALTITATLALLALVIVLVSELAAA